MQNLIAGPAVENLIKVWKIAPCRVGLFNDLGLDPRTLVAIAYEPLTFLNTPPSTYRNIHDTRLWIQNTTHLNIYIGNIFVKKIAHITAAYKIIEYYIGVIIKDVIRAGYRLPAKCVWYMGLVWAERRNITHTVYTITRQLKFVFLQSGSFLYALQAYFCLERMTVPGY